MKARTLTGPTELLTFFEFPKPQWKTLRTTNTIERLHGEFRRRVKTQGSFRRSRKQMIASLTFPPVAGRSGFKKITTMVSGIARPVAIPDRRLEAGPVSAIMGLA